MKKLLIIAAPVQEPVEVDQATMELAESVGLIGPASRTHDLHAAIQRFHDLICVNATIKAAKMAADAISESTPPAAQPATEESSAVKPAAPVQEPVWFSLDEVKPIEGQMVLAWYKGFAYPDTAVWLGTKGWAMDSELASPYWDEVQNPITHWMPLPQGPLDLNADPTQNGRSA
jgi:hypothetical protein